MNDPYDSGTPKYQTAQSIYDALRELVQTEEMCILSEMGADVSYDNQTYYYTDKGYGLQEKFEELSGYGGKMWIMDLAALQVDRREIHDTVYEALNNSDLAKRIGFKKLFVEYMLNGKASLYNEISEAYANELDELDFFNNWEMIRAFNRVLEARGEPDIVTPYPRFSYALSEKVMNLKLSEQTQIIVECRALLTSYDDFIYGLRVNQALYEAQERMYKLKASQLQLNYEGKVKQLLMIAESKGLLTEFGNEIKCLESGGEILADNVVIESDEETGLV